MRKELSRIAVIGIDSRGRGTALHGERRVVVEDGLPGDLADLIVLGRRSGRTITRVGTLHEVQTARIRPFCAHYADCGGCTLQHLSYEAQLRLKEAMLRAAFNEAGFDPIPPISPTVPAPAEREYRNKLEYSAGAVRWIPSAEVAAAETIEERRALGFHVAGRFDRVLDVQRCHLQSEPSNAIREAVRDYALAHDLSFYHHREHHGFLRQVHVRTALSGEVQVTLVFGPDALRPRHSAHRQGLIDHLRRAVAGITSLNVIDNGAVNDGYADLAVQNVWGTPHIVEWCGPLRLHITPKTFYQTNSQQAQALYAVALAFAAPSPTTRVLDLYCGIGSIGLTLAPHVAAVVGVEMVPDSVAAAAENAHRNGIRNATFHVGAVESTLATFYSNHGPFDVVIVDPPRAGLHPQALAQLLATGVPRIVYVSCNPRTLAADLRVLSRRYAIGAIQPVDMFPQTKHLETVVLLDILKEST